MKAIIYKKQGSIFMLFEGETPTDYDSKDMFIVNNVPQYVIDDYYEYYYEKGEWKLEEKRPLSQEEKELIKKLEAQADEERKKYLSNAVDGEREYIGASEKAVGEINNKVDTNANNIIQIQQEIKHYHKQLQKLVDLHAQDSRFLDQDDKT
ncbi:hypothetical protein [Vibrio coralliilyticus]|uniref:hypothetical protein n=1 Tax=Vibrio coralliilyticus TaxID=190893 RepID=UPI00185D09A3|nr:hypothetical protein [Vibrio coralliilyticus]NUW69548.1 hypothetical protein [Vibrio coralliilyticus]